MPFFGNFPLCLSIHTLTGILVTPKFCHLLLLGTVDSPIHEPQLSHHVRFSEEQALTWH